MEKSKCPEVRFKGFTLEWEEFKLENMFTFYRGEPFSKSDIVKDGDFKCIHYGELFTKYNSVIDEVLSSTNTKGLNFGRIGDILMPSSDVTPDGLAKASCLKVDNVLLGGDINVLRPISLNSSVFISYQINHSKEKILKCVTGTTVKHLYNRDLKELSYLTTTFKEQTQIGKFFQNFDQSIALHEKKLTQTQNLKKAMLEKIFPKAGSTQPEIRLKGFSGDWEVTELGNIVEFSKGKGISKQDILKTGSTSCIRYGELYTTYGSIIEKVISKTNCDKKDYILSKANQVLIPASGETQIDIATASCILESGVIIGGDLNILTTKEDGVFLSIYLSFIKKYEIAQLAQGNSVVHLYATQLQNLSIHYPCLAEQKVISQFFKQLDETLALQQQQLQTLKNLKQAFLEKMFV